MRVLGGAGLLVLDGRCAASEECVSMNRRLQLYEEKRIKHSMIVRKTRVQMGRQFRSKLKANQVSGVQEGW